MINHYNIFSNHKLKSINNKLFGIDHDKFLTLSLSIQIKLLHF